MKAQLLKDKRGRVIASINHTNEDAGLVPLDVALDEGGKVMELEIRPNDLLDLDKFYEKAQKK